MKHLCTLIYTITLLKHTDNELKWLGLVKQFIEIFISKAMLLKSHSLNGGQSHGFSFPYLGRSDYWNLPAIQTTSSMPSVLAVC